MKEALFHFLHKVAQIHLKYLCGLMIREFLSNASVKHNDIDYVYRLSTEQEVIIFVNEGAKMF